jgi:hypothetical protein
VRVAVERTLGVTVLATLLTCEVPDDQGLVSGSGKKHVGAIDAPSVLPSCVYVFLFLMFDVLFHAGSEGGDPARVAVELTAHDQLFGHVCVYVVDGEREKAKREAVSDRKFRMGAVVLKLTLCVSNFGKLIFYRK